MIFFIADTHFGHANIIRYCGRPFKDADEMDRVLIENWNSVVTNADTVYHLGDFSFGPAVKYCKLLNGDIIWVRGNHDKPLMNYIHHSNVPYMRVIKIDGYPDIVLSHFAMRVWHKSHFNSWHLYGHSHGTLEGQGKSFDVGVDCWNYTPVSIEQIAAKMKTVPDNVNYLRKLKGYNQEEFEQARNSEDD